MTALSNNQLATGSTDQTIKIFNLNDGTLVRHLKGHTGTINSIVLLTNGNLASGSADNTIREWSLNDGSLKKSMTEHTSSVLKLSILGVNLISGSDDSKIKIWPIANMNLNYYDYHTARSKGTLERHKSFIQSLVALPNGYLASGSNDFEINIWDTETNRIIKTFKGHSGTVNCLIGLQNGNIVSSSEDMTVREWKWNEREENRTNITSGNQLSKILFAGEIVTSMVLLKDNHLAMSHFRKVTILNLKTGIVTQTLNEFTTWVRCLTLLSNGNLVTATDDGKIKVWNLDEERITLNEIKEMINNELGGLESA
jgi:WD40 repeat protein